MGKAHEDPRHWRRVDPGVVGDGPASITCAHQTVDELMASPDDHVDREVAVRGEVAMGP